MTDYKTPWSVENETNSIRNSDGSRVCSIKSNEEISRIVACVNACEGMDDPAADMLQAVEEMVKLSKKHEELLRTCADIVMSVRNFDDNADVSIEGQDDLIASIVCSIENFYGSNLIEPTLNDRVSNDQ